MECNIRPWEMGDAIHIADAINNKKVQDNLRDGISYPYTLDDGKDFVTAMISADKEKVYAFAITVDDIAIGSIGVFRQDNIHAKTAEMGYYISEQYWGQGIGTSAVKQTCLHIFANTDIVRIYAEPFASNLASCRILEKAGFAYEGTLKKNAWKNNEFLDMKMYALVKD